MRGFNSVSRVSTIHVEENPVENLILLTVDRDTTIVH